MWQQGLIIDGEKAMVNISRRSMSVCFDDYRDDFDYVDADQEAIANEIEEDSMGSALELAKAALAAIPDISCASVAEAFGLSEFAVRAISTNHSRKATKFKKELSWYTREEIMGAICANQQ